MVSAQSEAVLFGVLFCVVAVAVAVGGVQPADGSGSADAGLGDLSTEEFEADRTQFRITVFENGSAEWTFRYEQRLESDDAVAEFEAYAERFTDEETESYNNFRTRAISLTESGSDVTDRNMTAESFGRDARVEERSPAGDEFGVVEMSFVWTEFAAPEGDHLVVGDVFVDGLYVGPDQQLRFDRGPMLRFESVDPAPDSIAGGTLAESESVTWVGETQFTDRRPRVVYAPRNDGSPPATATESGPTDETSAMPADTGSFLPIIALVVVVLLGAGSAIAYRAGAFRTTDDSDDKPDTTTTEAETATPAEGVETPDTEPTPTAGEEITPGISDADLRSDDERIIVLLKKHGGRMKQVDIVSNTDWSKSKVSMLLSEMEEDGVISKLRVGRENIVSLAGQEPDAAGSPFDDE